MLEMRYQTAQRLRPFGIGGIATSSGGGHVMGLIDDQQIKAARIDRLAGTGEGLHKEPHGPIALEKIDRSDQARKMRPGIDVQSALTPQHFEQLAIHDPKFQAELI